MSIKDMVKGKKVKFIYYVENELWYTTECGFEFPVPISDTGKGAFNAEDKAILYMRWIRKHLELIEGSKVEKSDFQKEIDHIGFTLITDNAQIARIAKIKK